MTTADAGRLAELADRLHAVEARLARFEAGRDGPGHPAPTAPAAEPTRSRRVDRRRPSPVAGPVLIAVPNLAAAPSAAVATEAAAEFDRRFGAIFTLADAGAPLDEVAQRTGYPVGQVELILGLRPARPTTGPGNQSSPRRGDTDV